MKAEIKARELYEKLASGTLPVDVAAIVGKLDVDLVEKDLPDEVHGAFYPNVGGRPIIIINKRQSRRRRRFTIAHELAHYLLNHSSSVHLDDQVLFRKERVGNVKDTTEIAANVFAAELLMPRDLVYKHYAELASQHFSDDDELVGELSKRFDVSAVAMGFRLKNLRLVKE